MNARFRRLVSLFLVGLFCLTTANFAFAGVAAELQHQLSQSESHTPPQGGDGAACDHCCACHYSSHLSSATGAASSAAFFAMTQRVAARCAMSPPPCSSDAFFRPPRIS